jgi:hypothetical protein
VVLGTWCERESVKAQPLKQNQGRYKASLTLESLSTEMVVDPDLLDDSHCLLLPDLLALVMEYRGPLSLDTLLTFRSYRMRKRWNNIKPFVNHVYINTTGAGHDTKYAQRWARSVSVDIGRSNAAVVVSGRAPPQLLDLFPSLRSITIDQWLLPFYPELLVDSRLHNMVVRVNSRQEQIQTALRLFPSLKYLDGHCTHVDADTAVLLLKTRPLPWKELHLHSGDALWATKPTPPSPGQQRDSRDSGDPAEAHLTCSQLVAAYVHHVLRAGRSSTLVVHVFPYGELCIKDGKLVTTKLLTLTNDDIIKVERRRRPSYSLSATYVAGL